MPILLWQWWIDNTLFSHQVYSTMFTWECWPSFVPMLSTFLPVTKILLIDIFGGNYSTIYLDSSYIGYIISFNVIQHSKLLNSVCTVTRWYFLYLRCKWSGMWSEYSNSSLSLTKLSTQPELGMLEWAHVLTVPGVPLYRCFLGSSLL